MEQFTIVKKIGSGSFGTVLKVIRKADLKVYAIKQIAATRDSLNEVRLLASFNHPHLIKYYECFPFRKGGGTKLGIVMEYAEAGDLYMLVKRHRRRGTRINESRIWKYMLQISSVLQFLHKNNIIHRDLKTANCFLTKNDDVMVGDLNISKVMKNKKLARTNIGTPYYMSPEIVNGIPYNEKCDIWALGCLVYELAVLKPPFQGVSRPDLIRAINSGRRVKRPIKNYAENFWKLIDKMLYNNPINRPSADKIQDIASNVTKLKINACNNGPNQLLTTIKMPAYIPQRYSNLTPKIINATPHKQNRALFPRMRQLNERLPPSKYAMNTLPSLPQVKPPRQPMQPKEPVPKKRSPKIYVSKMHAPKAQGPKAQGPKAQGPKAQGPKAQEPKLKNDVHAFDLPNSSNYKPRQRPRNINRPPPSNRKKNRMIARQYLKQQNLYRRYNKSIASIPKLKSKQPLPPIENKQTPHSPSPPSPKNWLLPPLSNNKFVSPYDKIAKIQEEYIVQTFKKYSR